MNDYREVRILNLEETSAVACVATIAAGVAQQRCEAGGQRGQWHPPYHEAAIVAARSWAIYNEIVRVQEERLAEQKGGE